MVPWIGFVSDKVVVIGRKARSTNTLIVKINHRYEIPELSEGIAVGLNYNSGGRSSNPVDHSDTGSGAHFFQQKSRP